MKKISVQGKIVRGTKGASGLGDNKKFTGTIAKQKPYFKYAKVERVDSWYEGTINLNIEPKKFEILKPDYVITAEWKSNVTETFWLVDVILEHKDKRYPAYIYYPCPSAVKTHSDSVIEVLAEKVESLKCGDVVSIELSTEKIKLVD